MNFPVPLEYINDISGWVYMRYHVENHLNEIYILKTRLIWYIWALKNAYNRHPDWIKIRSGLDKIKVLVELTLKWIVDTRDEHVHEERFSDNKLDQINYFELLTKSKDTNFVKMMEIPLNIAYSEWKDKWEGIMNNNIDTLIEIKNEYFWWLLNLLQDTKNNKDIIYPEDIR